MNIILCFSCIFLVLKYVICILFHVQRVVDWLADNFKRDEGIDLLKDKQALQRLTETAEKAKMELSSLTQANIRHLTPPLSVCTCFSLWILCGV